VSSVCIRRVLSVDRPRLLSVCLYAWCMPRVYVQRALQVSMDALEQRLERLRGSGPASSSPAVPALRTEVLVADPLTKEQIEALKKRTDEQSASLPPLLPRCVKTILTSRALSAFLLCCVWFVSSPSGDQISSLFSKLQSRLQADSGTVAPSGDTSTDRTVRQRFVVSCDREARHRSGCGASALCSSQRSRRSWRTQAAWSRICCSSRPP
jgi:hypothetical protein